MVPRATRGLTITVLATLFVGARPACGQAMRAVLPYSMATEHLFVCYAEGAIAGAEEAAKVAEECIARLRELTGLVPTRRIRLYLAETHEDFEALVGQPESFSIQGRADASEGLIVVRAGGGPNMRSLLAHEILHVVLGQALEGSGATAPLWLNEGLAEWVGDEVTPGDQSRRPATAGRVFTLDQLDSVFPRDPAGADLAYAESRSFVEFVQERTGDRGLRRLVESLRAKKSIQPAFEDAYGRPLAAFEAEWRPRFASGVRRPWPIDPATAIFMLMSVLFVVVVLLRARRARKRRMEEEEADDEWDEEPYWEAPEEDRDW